MIKKIFSLSIGLLMSITALAQEVPVTFCESFDDDFNPTNESSEFEGTQVSWFFKLKTPINKPEIVISIYKNEKSGSSEILERETIDVNPKWGIFGIKYFDFDEIGSYEIGVTDTDGNQLASGVVTLVEAKQEIAKHEEEKAGSELKALFNKYAPK